ncbi:TRSP domain-containing protein, partial [Bacillus pumilus]|uniref:TRSP domain-containing protein n=1 Tax=Bacillus pumilus TaxID=1408 RepID=UPI003704BC01
MGGHWRYIDERGGFGLKGGDRGGMDEGGGEGGLKVKKEGKGKERVCLGRGEVMYTGMRVAADMGEGV